MRALSVLVVEDDANIGMLLVEVLAGMGYDVCPVENTEAGAVAAARRCRPDLMIIDVELGFGSGLSAVEEITRGGPIPHVFMSAARVLEWPTDAVVLHKPFREPELVSAMRRVLGDAPFA